MARTNKNLQRYARMLREAQAGGWTIDVLIEAALGPDALKPRYEADERPLVLDLYREGIGSKSHAKSAARDTVRPYDFTT